MQNIIYWLVQLKVFTLQDIFDISMIYDRCVCILRLSELEWAKTKANIPWASAFHLLSYKNKIIYSFNLALN